MRLRHMCTATHFLQYVSLGVAKIFTETCAQFIAIQQCNATASRLKVGSEGMRQLCSV